MQRGTNQTSETEGPLRRVAPGALRGAPTGTQSAGQRTFPDSAFFTRGRLQTGQHGFSSTDRAHAGPTDKG
jgi:hypothetical protein